MVVTAVPLILIVDDNPDHLFLAQKALSRNTHHQVEIAESGPEALDKLKEKTFSLVILDYNMPGMNGLETLGRVQEIDPNLPVVMLTGGGSETLAVELIKRGAFDYVVKSGDYITALPAIVERALQHRQLIQRNLELEQERVKLTKLSAIVETAITVNHEINNPLFAIKANTQLLQRRYASGDPRLVRNIEGILESCERISLVTHKLASLVEPTSRSYAAGSSMLDLSHSEASSMPDHDSTSASIFEDSTDQVTDYLPILWQIHNALSSSLDLDHVLTETVTLVTSLLKGIGCAIGLVDADENTLTIRSRCWPGPDGNLVMAPKDDQRSYRIDEFPILAEIFRTGTAQILDSINDPRLTEKELGIFRFYNSRSIVIAPMIHQGKPIGILALDHHQRSITPRESTLCQLIAGQATLAIRNAIQHHDLIQRNEQFRTLVDGWWAANAIIDLDHALQVLANLAARVMNARIAVIRLLDDDQLILGAVSQNVPQDEFEIRPTQPADKGLAHIVLNTDVPVAITDLWGAESANLKTGLSKIHTSLKSYLGVKLIARGRLIGIMGVYTSEVHQFTEEEMSVFSTLASQAAIGIDNVRLYQESLARTAQLSEKADQIKLQNEIIQAILASNQIEDICDVLVQNAPRLIPAELINLTLVDIPNQTYRLVASWSDTPSILHAGSEIHFSETTFPVEVLIQGDPVLFDDITTIDDPHVIQYKLAQEGFRSILLIPVLFGGELIGFLAFHSRQSNVYHPGAIQLAQELAAQVAVALQNASLLERVTLSKSEWVATFDAITHPVWVQALDCSVLKVNRSAALKSGMAPQELIGMRCCQSLLGRPISCQQCLVYETLTTGEPVVREEQDLSGAAYMSSAYPVFKEDGKQVATVLFMQEITEQKRIQRQLNESSKLAAVGELAAGAAHNFSNLLTGVRGAIDLLLMQADRENLTPKVVGRLQTIKERLEQGDSIISRLMTFTRSSSEQPEEIVLGSIVSEALGVCETHSDRKGIALKLAIPYDLPNVLGVPSHLQQVLVNLIINAFQATESGGTVRIIGSSSPTPGYVQLQIQDTGCGISQEDLSRVFEPFYTKRRGSKSGTGLGLSVSRSMIEAGGGSLTVESVIGQGSTFTITLPACNGPQSKLKSIA